jgi:hypothetical protein
MSAIIAMLVKKRKRILRAEIAGRIFFKMFSIQEVNPAEFYHSRSFALGLFEEELSVPHPFRAFCGKGGNCAPLVSIGYSLPPVFLW